MAVNTSEEDRLIPRNVYNKFFFSSVSIYDVSAVGCHVSRVAQQTRGFTQTKKSPRKVI